MGDMIEFLNARLDEIDPDDYHNRTECDLGKLQFFGDCSCMVPEQVRRDIRSKRRLLGWHTDQHDLLESSRPTIGCRCYDGWPCTTLRLLALPYADHEDYREDWRP